MLMPPAYLLERFDGIARGSRLAAFGCSRADIRRATDGGSILRVRQGVFALPGLDPDIVTAARHGGALTCIAALRAHGVWVLPNPDGEVHVWMGEAGRTHQHPECDCTTHYSKGRAGLGLAPLTDCLIHAFRCVDAEAFFVSFESAWEKRLISTYDIARIRAALPPAARWMIDIARFDAGSGLESLLRFRLHLLGLTLTCQVGIEGVGRVDFVISGRVILEVDGKENHDGPDKRHRDLVRDAAASALGYETRRFDYAQIVHDWPTVIAAIRGALLRATR